MYLFQSRVKSSLAALVLAGVIAAGCGGGDTREPASGATEAESDSLAKMRMVLARVGSIEITGADVRNHMLKRSSLQDVNKYLSGTGGADILQVALASLMDQYVWSETAKQSGFELSQDDQHQVRALESELLATRYVGKVIQGMARPTREEVEEIYLVDQSKYLSPYRSAVRHILVKTQAEAERIKTEAQGGADFAALAKQHSIDENTKDFGGALGYLEEGRPILGMGRDPAFMSSLLAMDQGEYAVLKSDRGWHVAYVEKKEGGELIPLDDVYEDISNQVLQKNFGKTYNRELIAAREATNASFITENFETFTSTAGNTNRLLHLAHDIPDMGGRIEAYRRLAYDFPDSREAPEAQFMLFYLCVTVLKDYDRAEREYDRLRRRFARSPWKKAGNYLKEHMDDPVETIGTPREIFQAAQ